jgi:polyhydroxyalkanoate synthesis regulator phasin
VHTNELVNEHEIMQQAYAQANEIVRLATQQGQDILDKAVSEANAYRNSAAQYMDDLLAQLEDTTANAQNSLTSIFSGFHTNMSDYIETIRQNRAELLPQNEEAYAQQMEQEQNSETGELPAGEAEGGSDEINMM